MVCNVSGVNIVVPRARQHGRTFSLLSIFDASIFLNEREVSITRACGIDGIEIINGAESKKRMVGRTMQSILSWIKHVVHQ